MLVVDEFEFDDMDGNDDDDDDDAGSGGDVVDAALLMEASCCDVGGTGFTLPLTMSATTAALVAFVLATNTGRMGASREERTPADFD